MQGTGLSYKLSIGYRDLFDDFESVDPRELIQEIPTLMILKTSAFFLAQLHTAETKEATQLDFLQTWMARVSYETKHRAAQFIVNNNLPNRTFSFLNNYALLILTQFTIANSNQITERESLSEDEELRILKLYLFLFQTFLDKQEVWSREVQLTEVYQQSENPIERILMIVMPSQIAIEEVQKLKDFRIQSEKARYFFEFCESDEVFQGYLNIFLEEQGFETWQQYLKFLFSTYVRPFTDGAVHSILHVPDQYS